MIWLIRASVHFFVSLTIVVVTTLFPTDSRSQAEVDLVVQPASRQITLTGYTRSQTTMTLSSEVAGRVLQINYEDGQVIGELPFLHIDSTFVDLEISSIQHTLDQLKITGSKRRLEWIISRRNTVASKIYFDAAVLRNRVGTPPWRTWIRPVWT